MTKLASFPLARREGPSNNVKTYTPILVSDTETILLPENNSRASFMIRNESRSQTVRLYFETGKEQSGVMLLPYESLVLTNIKSKIFAVVPLINQTAEIVVLETST